MAKEKRIRYWVKTRSLSSWVYLRKTYKYADEAQRAAVAYSKQWGVKAKVVYFEATEYGCKEIEVRV